MSHCKLFQEKKSKILHEASVVSLKMAVNPTRPLPPVHLGFSLATSFIFQLFAFLWNCFLCWDRSHGDVPLWLGAALLFAWGFNLTCKLDVAAYLLLLNFCFPKFVAKFTTNILRSIITTKTVQLFAGLDRVLSVQSPDQEVLHSRG